MPILPSELQMVAPPPTADKNYNCFLFMLGLHENASVINKTGGFIYSFFIEHLIACGELIEAQQMQEGTLVLYKNLSQNENEFTHGGILQADGSVISKWSWGPLLIHKMFAVPLAYGDTVLYYDPISKEQALHLLEKYHALL